MKTTFNLDFLDTYQGDKLAAINGYSQAIRQLCSAIAKETEFSPKKRMVDGVTLLDAITEVSAVITQRMELITQ